MAPHTPQRSERPGEPVALLDNARPDIGAGALLDHGSHFQSCRRSQSITWRVQIQA